MKRVEGIGREQLKEGVEKRRRNLDKGEKGIGRVVDEKTELAKVSRELCYPTKEGAAEIKKALIKSAEEMKKEFTKKNKELKGIHKECKGAEDDFKKRTQMAKDNAKAAKETEGKMHEVTKAKPHLDRAVQAAKKDAEFTDKERRRQKARREKSIKRSNELNAKLQSITLKL